MLLELDDANINDLQRASILRLIERARHAHYTNIYFRINGQDEVIEADWLKHLRVATPADKAKP